MKRLLFSLLLLLPIMAGAEAAKAPSQDSVEAAWVQATSNGFEARIVAKGDECPSFYSDGKQIEMKQRAASSAAFPLLCSAPVPANAKSIGYLYAEDCPKMPSDKVCLSDPKMKRLPLPVANPRRILVLGDTGCRIKGDILQACNDPAKWPFPQVAAAAAKMHPDLVIHVGDYLYRESACPTGNPGCAGSPWGDNWITWDADFFTPAAPLLAAAPIVLARGNHEDCKRAGPGWERLQGPSAFAQACTVHEPLFMVDLGDLRLALLDDAVSDETALDPAMAQTYATEIAGLGAQPSPVWFVHHRPTWAAITGPLGLPIGGNLTLIEASKINASKGGPLMPPTVALQLSGHIHTFENLNYDEDVPPQLVAGNGGDLLDVTPKDLRGAFFQGGAGVAVKEGLSAGGFGFLMMTRSGEGWMIDLYDQTGTHTRTCRFIDAGRPGTYGKTGRLYCPTAE